MLLSAGDLNSNKNHRSVIETLFSLDSKIFYVIWGKGILRDKYLMFIKNQVYLADLNW